MHSPNVVRVVAVAVLLNLVLAACGGGSATPAASNNPSANSAPPKSEAPAAPSGSLSAQGVDACKLITAEDVQRISAYDGAKFEGKEGYCAVIVGDGKLNIGVSLGMDTGVDMSGNEIRHTVFETSSDNYVACTLRPRRQSPLSLPCYA